MDHYRLYLRAELGKLKNLGDAQGFLANSRCRPAENAEALMALFASQTHVDAFVELLSDDDAVRLANCCSAWRRNGVAARLAAGILHGIHEVPTASIDLNQAESGLRPAFVRNGWRLADIALDPEVLATPPYVHHTAGEPVEFQTVLSDPPDEGRYRLFDGMHRAIQIARNGDRTLCVAVVGPRPAT